MAKTKSIYICSSCGYESLSWLGRCPECGAWSTLEEQAPQISTITSKKSSSKNSVSTVDYSASASQTDILSKINSSSEIRYRTFISELDRVLGGGIVKGSVILLSGDPGIGKSTILLQICDTLASNEELKVLYISGEESKAQIKLRADRLDVNSDGISVLCEDNIEAITGTVMKNKPDLVIIDSIQTMNHPELNSSPGSVTQVRECTNLLRRVAKSLDIPVIIVGHVNKDGNIAGPKVLEHIVDAVLYFEGERNMSFRILRAIKNRFGSTNEIGVFEMTDKGLQEVENPSQTLISGRPSGIPGDLVACVMEGTRPILAEIQALVSPTSFGNPRRMTNGFDYNRLAMLLAVLEKRAGYFFGNMDAYINIVGGMKLDEPALDLTIAMALVSSLKDYAIRDDVIAFGEIGLAGEIRSVSHIDKRINEASRLGFSKCIIPYYNAKSLPKTLYDKIEIKPVKTVRQAFEALIT